MARPKRFRGAKATPKKLEKELLEKSKELAKNPSLLIPRCEGSCKHCDFEKILKKMEKVATYSDKPDKLQILAMRGDQLVRAYAATISLAAAGKIPFLGTAKLPAGDVSFAVRGKVDKEKIIGVQYYDDPDLRLLAYWDIARKRDLHLYSTPQGLVCSSHPKAPNEYMEAMLEESPYKLMEDRTCGHSDARVKLVVRWLSSGITIQVCEECLEELNLVQYLSSRIASRDPTDDFQVQVEHDFEYMKECAPFAPFPMPSDLSKDYLGDKLNDKGLVSAYVERKLRAARDSGEKVYIVGEQYFGDDREAFLDRIRGSEVEKQAVARLLREKEIPVVTDSDLAGRIISDLWKSHGRDMLSYVADENDVEEARKQVDGDSPASLLKEAARVHMNRMIHSSLPAFSQLGEIGHMADSLARKYKTEGKEATLRAMEKNRSRGHRQRAVEYAFINYLGEADAKAWQFTSEEKDFGSYLAQFAMRLMESEGEGYYEALKVLVDASGAMEEVKRD
jgi:hypothetical protein